MTAALPQIQPNQLEQWNAWIAAPRPRIVRLKPGYRFWVTLLAATCAIIPSLLLGILIVEWRAGPAKQTMKSDLWSAIPFIVLPLILLLSMFWILISHRRLVGQGEMSIGKVTGVRSGKRGPLITYEFLDRSGHLITASSEDDTRSYSVLMVIPVFYNPENPETNHVPLCGTVYEIAPLKS